MCAAAIAEAFRGNSEILVTPMGTLPSIGARLARLTFNPDLLLSDGESLFLAGVPPLCAEADVVEGWIPFRQVFDVVAYGKRHVMMGATQIDREGNQNISAIGDFAQPKRQLLGSRGAPGNTVNNRTSYWVPKHSTRVFVEQVDIVSGVGRAPAAAGPAAASSTSPPGRERSRGARPPRRRSWRGSAGLGAPGRDGRRGREATGFELQAPADLAVTRVPSAEELSIIARCSTRRRCGYKEVSEMSVLQIRPRFTELTGVKYPIVQTGMGGCPAPADGGTAAAGGLGIIARAR